MTKNRIKVAPAPVITRAQMEQKVARIAKLKVAEQARVAEMNGEIEMIKRQHATPLDTIRQELDIHCEDVRIWAEANPADFGKLRSLDLTHAIIGWRTGMPSLKLLRGWSWDRVLETLKAVGCPHIRINEEVNKQAILDDRENIGATGLRAMGVEVKQTDSFFIEAKIAQPEKREVA